MTPSIDQNQNPLSIITTAALEDLGYTVDSGAADLSYTLPPLPQGFTCNRRRLARKLSQAQEEAQAYAVQHGKDLLDSQFNVTSSVEGRNDQLGVVSVVYLDPDTGNAVSIIVRG